MINGFKIIGISTRTTNANNKAANDLGKLWGSFFSEDLINKIPNKLSSDIFAIYTDYKSDFTEEYTAIIGIPVSNLSDIPEGLIGREFPSETFKIFTAKGEMPMAVGKEWNEIWEKDAILNRKYTYDFEVYGPKSQNGSLSEVEIYLATEN